MIASRPRLALAVLASVAVTVAAGCGVPYSSDLATVDSDEIPFGLAATSTTTTTTTLAPTTTVIVLEATTTTVAPTTTLSTQTVEIVYIAGNGLTRIPREVAGEATLQQVLAVMRVLPTGDSSSGVRGVIPEDAEIQVEEDRGVATVGLPEDFFDSMTSTEQRLVIGQIVLTLTGRPSVGQVEFLLDGEPLRVILGDGSTALPGATVSREDYEALLGGVPTTTTTTTTTSTTTTTTTTTTTVPDTAAPTSPP